MEINEISKIRILQRLRKIEGQIRGIQSMIIDNRSCSDILIQVSAVKSALNSVNKLLLEEKVNSSLNFTADISLYQDTLDEIIELINKFLR